ncbi:MAG: hypothetical protein ACK4QL_01785 [Pseudanabaenaceae cyanobacterium]
MSRFVAPCLLAPQRLNGSRILLFCNQPPYALYSLSPWHRLAVPPAGDRLSA